jgi:hypothetical protein
MVPGREYTLTARCTAAPASGSVSIFIRDGSVLGTGTIFANSGSFSLNQTKTIRFTVVGRDANITIVSGDVGVSYSFDSISVRENVTANTVYCTVFSWVANNFLATQFPGTPSGGYLTDSAGTVPTGIEKMTVGSISLASESLGGHIKAVYGFNDYLHPAAAIGMTALAN